MSDETKSAHEGVDGEGCPPGYESPRLTLVGNLNDLLAGTGSLNEDGGNCSGTGLDPTPC
jgi:hypothetical protein